MTTMTKGHVGQSMITITGRRANTLRTRPGSKNAVWETGLWLQFLLPQARGRLLTTLQLNPSSQRLHPASLRKTEPRAGSRIVRFERYRWQHGKATPSPSAARGNVCAHMSRRSRPPMSLCFSGVVLGHFSAHERSRRRHSASEMVPQFT